ncbi:MAG: hypothetical protein JWO57_3857 [Pseudonocardiales bacterium]|nr:hypothetical protein [Pseudonocardiales bacterium]
MSGTWSIRRGARWGLAGALAVTSLAIVGPASVSEASPARSRAIPARTPATTLSARTILSGTSHGWSSPDDLTHIGSDLFVSFQNGVPSTGGTTGTPTHSTIVKFTSDGRIEQTWQLTGKCDGLTADTVHDRVIATVNEDGNSSLYTIPAESHAPVSHYAYDAAPLPHGGGTDSITIYHGRIYVVASAPSPSGPALYEVSLHSGIAHLAAAPFYDSSLATVANLPSTHAAVNLALTDPDSSTVVPNQSPRFRGSFMLTAQGDQQAIFAAHLGGARQQLQVLNLSQSVDDTAFATSAHGALITTDSTAQSVVLITGALTPGTAFTSVTPGNANTPPSPAVPNYLGRIDLRTGAVSAVSTAGQAFTPHALIFVPIPN